MLIKKLNRKIESTSIISDIFLLILALFLCYVITLIPFIDYFTIVPQPFPAVLVVFLNVLLESILFLLFALLTRKIKPALFITTYFNLIYSTLNIWVRVYRGRQINFHDMYSVKTFLTVSSDYASRFPSDARPFIVIGIIYVILFTIFLIKIKFFVSQYKFYITAPILILFSVIFFFTAKLLPIYPWENCGACYNGPLVEFYLEFANRKIEVPENYSNEYAISLLSDVEEEDPKPNMDRPENIIVIMNEAFCDPEVSMPESSGKISNKDVTPFIEELKKESVHGYAYSSVYGGNTATSEWEFLTGETQQFIPMYSVAYNQFLDTDQDSLVTLLKNNGYYAEAMHQNYPYGYNREAAYKYLGFDRAIFKDEFTSEDILREYRTDDELYKKIIEEIKDKENLFLFSVSIQNHAPYTWNLERNNIKVKKYVKDEEWNEYLNLLSISDNALKDFISNIKNSNEKTLIVFFGDHAPMTENNLDTDIELYKIPYFIWKNYDNTEKIIEDDTSINYLPLQVLDEAGIKKDDYFLFLEETKKHMNIITEQFLANGSDFYKREDKNIPEDIKEWRNKYNIVQYYRECRTAG